MRLKRKKSPAGLFLFKQGLNKNQQNIKRLMDA
jgi:hypothetical protein